MALLLGRWASQSAADEQWRDWLHLHGPPITLIDSLLSTQGYSVVHDPALQHRGLRLFPGPLPEIAPNITPSSRADLLWTSFDPENPGALSAWILVLEPESLAGHLWIRQQTSPKNPKKTIPTPLEWRPLHPSWEGLSELSQKWMQLPESPQIPAASHLRPPTTDPREIRY